MYLGSAFAFRGYKGAQRFGLALWALVATSTPCAYARSVDSHCRRRVALVVAAVIGGVLALPGGAAAVTATVGRQNLTSFNDYFHCEGGSSTNCDNSFSPTGLTALGDRVRVPADGRIVAWRVVGACVKSGGVACYHWLRVLRPDGGQFKFVSGVDPLATSSTCDRCAPLDGSKIDVSPALAVETGDYIALSEEAVHAVDARVMVASAMGGSYNVF